MSILCVFDTWSAPVGVRVSSRVDESSALGSSTGGTDPRLVSFSRLGGASDAGPAVEDVPCRARSVLRFFREVHLLLPICQEAYK